MEAREQWNKALNEPKGKKKLPIINSMAYKNSLQKENRIDILIEKSEWFVHNTQTKS